MTLRVRLAGALVIGFGVGAGSAQAQQPLTEVTFGTNWIAQGEHGGYYQAVADGTYEKYGLKVTIVPGGPRANNRMLMTVGKLDFYMGGSMIQAFSAVEKDIPTIVVAAHFQKEPQVLLSHPGQGLDTFQDLKKSNDILLSKDGFATFYQWMKVEFGFRDEQVKPFGFNPAPFIADKQAVQQGYVTSEPLTIEKAAGFKPNVFLLADHGFSTYSTTVETRREVVEKNPDLVQRFVDASTIGWYNYLYGDNTKAKALIKRDNPEMTDELLAYSAAKMKEYGIVDSGDTAKLGIGAMTDARMKDFFDKMVKAGLFKADLDYRRAYTLRFVNKGVGLDLKR
ncbi:ABC transporter substrate-binding protein [Microvirga subterranea]|uniref:NitT/TauT family transport system substrate-binding protein n=1 Tax=Microvirga subterranea TaxID=186651 RepID=A0A370HHJ6_9HYPH|nr:ABC transporter substrate-binding protein [Microvirga subterranea]RDI57102.1 NitT/TauT family transport system substrate-binding protein [Microvirga subterranea]